jgi:hypothetical protein
MAKDQDITQNVNCIIPACTKPNMKDEDEKKSG